MVTHQAIHATTATRLEAIRSSQRFRISSQPNRRGEGVYFWQKNSFWENIGRTWHRAAQKNGLYHGDADQRCGIIHAEISASEDRYFDFEADEFRAAVVELAHAKRLTKHSEEARICEIWNLLVEGCERKTGVKIAYFRVALALPSAGDWYPFTTIGNPIAFIVRDLESIRIEHYTVHEEVFNG